MLVCLCETEEHATSLKIYIQSAHFAIGTQFVCLVTLCLAALYGAAHRLAQPHASDDDDGWSTLGSLPMLRVSHETIAWIALGALAVHAAICTLLGATRAARIEASIVAILAWASLSRLELTDTLPAYANLHTLACLAVLIVVRAMRGIGTDAATAECAARGRLLYALSINLARIKTDTRHQPQHIAHYAHADALLVYQRAHEAPAARRALWGHPRARLGVLVASVLLALLLVVGVVAFDGANADRLPAHLFLARIVALSLAYVLRRATTVTQRHGALTCTRMDAEAAIAATTDTDAIRRAAGYVQGHLGYRLSSALLANGACDAALSARMSTAKADLVRAWVHGQFGLDLASDLIMTAVPLCVASDAAACGTVALLACADAYALARTRASQKT